MKHFLKFILKIVFATLIIAILLDVVYSNVYALSNSRGKIDFVTNKKFQNFDLIILGSSRANNHFVPQVFEQKGLKTFNFGISGGHLFESSLLLKLMIQNKFRIKNIIVETDLNLSNDKRADGIAARFLPYIHQSMVVKNHFLSETDFNTLYYIPFYRYLKFENKIGIRELFFSAIGKKTSHLQNKGFSSLKGNQNGNMKNNIKNLEPLIANKHYVEIKKICAKNNIRLISVMTPMCENVTDVEYFDKVKRLYPEIYNFENSVIENENFSSCGHLNEVGATKFSTVIAKEFFTN